ncbi:cytochrome P450 [Cronbergia sp. UHCC 0137]|uniref:cytochrome P450 n=1 Tax=Cronbergia sp. UHCC 0137 TaxID=3110239 RepID=UPI002B1EA6B4|nr:cytochrome P450 [Cronbergia sp. UHCC 0137]MEA5620136.1 cytochrome P450 [Cronbergia sp. UHCC 0137]
MTQDKSVHFSPFSPDFHRNPYPTYEYLRQNEPVHKSLLNTWIITSYADAKTILNSPSFRVDDLPKRLKQKNRYLKKGDLNTLSETIEKWLFFLEPPDHNRLRVLFTKPFSPTAIEAMYPEIQARVDNLLAKVQIKGHIDIIDDLASPLPAMTITHILGLPCQDYRKLLHWSNQLLFILEQPASLKRYQQQNEVAMEAKEYFLLEIEKQKKYQRKGLLGELINNQEFTDKFDSDEIVGLCIMLMVAGQETTKSLIGNGILALIEHHEKLNQIKQGKFILKNVIEELLRYDSPIQMVARIALEETIVSNVIIAKGDTVMICIGAANRDPAQFKHPNDLDFERQQYSLAFGGGIHYCLGGWLARIQAEIAINTLIRSFSNLKVDAEKIERHKSIIIRGLTKLPISFDFDRSEVL